MEHSFYITNSNFQRISQYVNVMQESLDYVFGEIYTQDLSKYLNAREAKAIYKSLKLISLSSKKIDELKQHIDLSLSVGKTSGYLFVSTPKYHFNDKCKALNSDFKNFYIPDEISQRGEEEVNKLREFAKNHRHLLNEGKEDLFIQKLKNEFLLVNELTSIFHANTKNVKTTVRVVPNIDDMVDEISQIITKIENMRKTEEGEKIVKDRIYLDHNSFFYKSDNPLHVELIKLKKRLNFLILQFNIFNNFEDGKVTFSEGFLNFFGISKCRMCCR